MEDNVCITQACGYHCGRSVPSVTSKYRDLLMHCSAQMKPFVKLKGAPFDSVDPCICY